MESNREVKATHWTLLLTIPFSDPAFRALARTVLRCNSGRSVRQMTADFAKAFKGKTEKEVNALADEAVKAVRRKPAERKPAERKSAERKFLTK